MASVTKCDVCGDVYRHEKCMCLELTHLNLRGGKCDRELIADLCPECTEKVKDFLGGKKNGFQ